ncbi:hypothetical protein PRK78_005800 [Emydomyces testavorans]|uniref:Uncharacterized protein n=1 Tax=Emydomyces testavorans TaxID=2070801 RepID=A0AAF0DKA9_9EURO|nr:hypothetical protein PRK78_005800 [Emydomyces testavorans]
MHAAVQNCFLSVFHAKAISSAAIAAIAPPLALFAGAAACEVDAGAAALLPEAVLVADEAPLAVRVADELLDTADAEAEAEEEALAEALAEPVEHAGAGRLVTPAVPQMPLANLTVARGEATQQVMALRNEVEVQMHFTSRPQFWGMEPLAQSCYITRGFGTLGEIAEVRALGGGDGDQAGQSNSDKLHVGRMADTHKQADDGTQWR